MIVMVVCLVYSIHVTSVFLRAAERGATGFEAARLTVRSNFLPLSIAAVTTVIGFLSLSASKVPPFQDLGLMASIGVVAGYLCAIFLLPLCLALVPVRFGRIMKPFGADGLGVLSHFVIRHHIAILVVATIGVIGSLAVLTTARIDDRYSTWFDERLQFRIDNDFTTQNLTGLYSIDFSVGGEEPDALLRPEVLKAADEFATWLRSQPEVLYVFSITDVIKKLNRNLHGEDPDSYILPADAEAAAQYMLMYEMSLPYGLDLTNRVMIDKSLPHPERPAASR